MLRAFLTVMLAALLVFTGAGGAIASPAPGGGVITLSGRLEYVTSVSAPHYEVGRAAVPEPIHLYGSPYYVLFGQIEAGDRSHRLVQDTPAGPVPVLIHSAAVDLSALTGQRVGLVASRDPSIPETPSYDVIAAVAVTEDVSALLRMGPIYTVPDWPISVMMGGKEVAMDQPPILGNGRTLVPLRAIGEALGASVSWDEATKTATLALGAREVKVTVGTNRVSIRETGWPENVIYCDVAPVVAGGRTLVPVRVVSESLGLKVGWDEATHTVTLN
ncbi:MAG TPA: copper amine oxidase N-terminal domain-containing protein [Symbiobacteriaceae bacterium]|nr:copper amine oxidase N-terminal domain-containing protein [Symbiobacteriaceae bacterium]